MSAYDNLEPLAAEKAKEQGLPHIEAYLLSIAISQKRLADSIAGSGNLGIIAAAVGGIQNSLSSVVELPGMYHGQSPAAIRTKSG